MNKKVDEEETLASPIPVASSYPEASPSRPVLYQMSSFGAENHFLFKKDQFAQKSKEQIKRHVKEGKITINILSACMGRSCGNFS